FPGLVEVMSNDEPGQIADEESWLPHTTCSKASPLTTIDAKASCDGPQVSLNEIRKKLSMSLVLL
ncbi:MAG: hypothetical protein WBA18_11150, partial [Terracidiphilus sp.]